MIRIRSLSDVVKWRLCVGCGACAYLCPERRVKLVDVFGEGIRPVVDDAGCGSCRKCLDGCPAVYSDFRYGAAESGSGASDAFAREWGSVVAIWEGHATDPEIRFQGSSGGVLTAIGVYCIEVLGMEGVLHIGQDPDDPIRNRTRLSRTRAAITGAAGSRYSPASVCNGLGLVENAASPCAVVGKPSDIAAVRKSQRLRSALDHKVGVTLSFFCAGSPSTRGTVKLLEKLGMDPSSVSDLRYRGRGWPGHFAPQRQGEVEPSQKIPYRSSWAFLQGYRPWSVQLWPDGSGELADITCGDPWYEEPDGKNPGFSLVLARTKRGREIIEGAVAKGYLTLQPVERWKLVKSQSGLLAKKGSVWGRRVALRMLGLPVTRLEGTHLWHCWRQLTFEEKVRSIVGTFRRIVTRKLYQPMLFNSCDMVPVNPPMLSERD